MNQRDFADRSLWPLLAITLLALALRLFRLDGQAVWMDEVASLGNARAFGSGGMVALAGADHIAPLHSILLWAAVRLGGANEIAMRMPSAIAGVLTVPAAWWVVRRMFDEPRVALIAALLVAVSPFAIWYAQEARMYSLLLLCAVLLVGLSWPVVHRPLGAVELLALTLVAAIGFYTHHYMVLLSMAFGLFLLVRGGARGIGAVLTSRAFWGWTLSQAVALALFGYWLWLTADKLHNNAGFPKPSALLWTPYTYFSFIVGLSYGVSVEDLRRGVGGALRSGGPAIAIAAAASLVVLLAGARAAARADRRPGGLWIAMWLTVPVALAIGATFVTNIQFNVRYVIICYPALAILLALALADLPLRTRGRWLVAAAAAVMLACMAVGLVNWYANPHYAKEEVRPLAAMLTRRPAEVSVVANNARVVAVLNFYGARLPRDTLAVDNIQWARTPQVVTSALARRGSMPNSWLIEYRDWETDPDGVVAAWFDRQARLESVQNWHGVSLRRYAAK